MSPQFSSVRPMLLATVVAFGITTVWFIAVVWVFSIVEQSGVARGDYEQLYVRIDGEPVIVKQALNGASRQVLSLDREPTAGDTYQILYPMPVSPGTGLDFVSSRDWMNRLASISDGGSPAIYWYLLHDGRSNGLAYGIGYNSVTKRNVGYFSRDGFSEQLPSRESWFQVKGDTGLAFATPDRTYYEPYAYSQPSLFVLANNKLWKIDTRKRTVKPLVNCPDAEGIGWAWQTAASLPDPAAHDIEQAANALRLLFVRMTDEALLIDPDVGGVKRYPLPEELRSATLAAFQLADERLLLVGSPQQAADGSFVTWIDPSGKVIGENRVAIDSPSRQVDEPTIVAVTAIAAPGVVWQGVMTVVTVLHKLTNGDADSVPSAIGQALAICWPAIAMVLATSVVGAIAAFRRQRRYGLPGAIHWAIFTFVFGVAGWIAYRLHRAWPPLEDCPACDQPAPRDREQCTECGAEFPLPALKGTEVFA